MGHNKAQGSHSENVRQEAPKKGGKWAHLTKESFGGFDEMLSDATNPQATSPQATNLEIMRRQFEEQRRNTDSVNQRIAVKAGGGFPGF